MASPGQRRGSCGHVMAGFDLHKKCARCRDKKVGDDPCVKGQDCEICDCFSDIQRGMLATPQYQIRKDKKARVLVSPSKVTVVGPVGEHDKVIMSSDAAHAHDQVVAGPSPMSFDHQASGDFVSRQDFEVLNNQLAEKFARFEALLSLSNIFSTPKLPVNVEHPPISDTPFVNPSSDPRATSPVRPPGQEPEGSVVRKDKGVGKSKHRKSSKPAAAAGSASQSSVDAFPASKTVVPCPGLQVLDKLDALSVSSVKSVASTVTLDQPVHCSSFQVLSVPLYRILRIFLCNRSLSCQMWNLTLFRTVLMEIPVRRANSRVLR